MNPWSVLVCVHVCVAGGLCTHMMNIYACPTPECWHLYTESGIFSLCRLLFIVILVGWDAPCLSSVTARLGLHWGSMSRDDLSGGGYEVRGLGSVCLCSNVDLQRHCWEHGSASCLDWYCPVQSRLEFWLFGLACFLPLWISDQNEVTKLDYPLSMALSYGLMAQLSKNEHAFGCNSHDFSFRAIYLRASTVWLQALSWRTT